jgi:hypothetical protein
MNVKYTNIFYYVYLAKLFPILNLNGVGIATSYGLVD